VSADLVVAERYDAFFAQELILLAVVYPNRELARLGLVFIYIVRSNAAGAGETRREINRYVAGYFIFVQVFAQDVDALFACYFLAKVSLIVRKYAVWEFASDQIEYIFSFEKMLIVGLAVFDQDILYAPLIRFELEHRRYFGLEKLFFHLFLIGDVQWGH
jgi:hypothetical protein